MPDPEKPFRSAYLGDGLHAEFDGWQIRLWAERGPGIVHEVFLEPSVIVAFQQFVKEMENRNEP